MLKTSKDSFRIPFEYLLICFLGLMIAPFLFLHFFNHPMPEDIGWGEEVRSLGFVEAQYFFYKIWSGRFFSYLLLSVNPLLFKSITGFRLLLMLLMIIFIYVIYAFISEVTRERLSFREKILTALSIFFLYLYALPSVAEGFYWLTSAVIYKSGIIFTLIFLIFYMRLQRTYRLSHKVFYTLLCSIAIMAVAGSNELAATVISFVILLLFLNSIIAEKRFNPSVILFAAITCVAVYIAFSSPGNSFREGFFPRNHDFIYSLRFSLVFIIEKMFSWIFITPLLAFTILLLPLISRILNKSLNLKLFSVNPLYSVIGLMVFLFIPVFTTIWNTGEIPFARTVNFTYFIFLIGWFYNLVVLMAYLKRKFSLNIQQFPRYVYFAAIVIIFLLLIKKNNIKTAYAELTRGAAEIYNDKLNERYNFIQENNSDSCKVDSIQYVPKSFLLIDITSDPGHLYNRWYARYFDKAAILLKTNNVK